MNNKTIKKVSFDINMLVFPKMTNTYNNAYSVCIGTRFINDLNCEEVTQDVIYDYMLKHKRKFFINENIKSKTIKKVSEAFGLNNNGITYNHDSVTYYLFVSNIQVL